MILVCAAHLQIGGVVQKIVEGTKGVGHTTDLAGTPYSLSEDFVSSYRMHPLLPDDYFIAGDEVCKNAATCMRGYSNTSACCGVRLRCCPACSVPLHGKARAPCSSTQECCLGPCTRLPKGQSHCASGEVMCGLVTCTLCCVRRCTRQVKAGDMVNKGARTVIKKYGMSKIIDAFGHQLPTVLQMHNYPNFLTKVEIPGAPDLPISALHFPGTIAVALVWHACCWDGSCHSAQRAPPVAEPSPSLPGGC